MDSYLLKSENIEIITSRAYDYYTSNNVDRKEALRTKLTIEEALLKYQETFGEDVKVEYNESKIFKQLKVSLYISGNSFNPFDIRETPDDIIMDSLLSTYSNTLPNWKFKNFVNQLDFTLNQEKRRGLIFKIICAIGIGVLLGLIARMLPGGLGVSIAENYARPLASAFAGLFCVMAVFLTFFAVSLGIVHAGDLSTLSSIGKHMLGRFFKIMSVITLATTIVILPAISLKNISLSSLSFKSIFDMFLQFIPSNPIKPLVEFNTAQILIVGVMFGLAMLILGSKTRTLESAFTECNVVAVTCNSFLNNSLIHVYVGLNFFIIVSSNVTTGYMQSIKMILLIVGVYIALFVIFTYIASKKLGVEYKRFIRILSPTLMINLSSASYGASFTTSIEALMNNGVDVDYASMGHNVGGLLFKPGYAVLLTVGTVLSSATYGVEFELGYIIMIVILSMALAMTLPTIPGAAVAGFTLMFTQLGLPNEALAYVLTLNAILDFFTVAINGVCLQSEIFLSANKAGRLNKDKLANN